MKLSKNFLGLAILVFVALACSQSPQTSNDKPAEINKAQGTATPAEKTESLVTDEAGVLSPVDKAEIEKALTDLKRATQVEFGIITIDTTNGEKLETRSLELARESDIGGEKGGALLVMAIKDRAWWIQIDKTLEAGLTGDEVGEIGSDMKDDLKAGNYASGIKKCIEKMSAKLAEKQKSK